MPKSALFAHAQSGGMFTIEDQSVSTGSRFYVHSGTGTDGAGFGQNPDSPVATIDYAVGLCTASKGDIIYVMPGHTETVAAANGLDFDVAGIRVIGLGVGSARPIINSTATGSTVRINANGVTLENLIFTGGIDAVAVVIDINGKTDATLKNIEYRDVTGQCTVFIKTANDTDRLTIDGLRYVGDSAAGTTAAIQLNGADDFRMSNFELYGNFANSAVELITTASNRIRILNGQIWTENSVDLCVKDTITASTGSIGPSLYLMLQDNAANITEAITGATFQLFDDIWVCNLAGEKAMLINTTASTDA